MIAIAALSMFAAIAALVYGLSGRRVAARAPIDRRLSRASGGEPVATELLSAGTALRGDRFGTTGLARTLATVPSLHKLSGLLEHSGWRLTVTEFLLVSAVSGVALAVFASSKLPLLLIPAGIVGGLLPFMAMKRAAKKRRSRFDTQLVDALAMLANAIKAGVGLMQAMDQACTQLKAPIASEFRRTLHDIQVGSTPDDAFKALNDRMQSENLDIVVTAITVQRSTGGNLAEILESVAFTMRERIRIKGEIKTLTSQQQLSGYLVAALPIFLLGLFSIVNPAYMAPLYHTLLGRVVLGGAGVLQVMGFFVIRKIVNIEV